MDARLRTRPYRLGAFLDGIGWVEYEYGRVWQRKGDTYLAGPDFGQIDLILNLCGPIAEPFSLRYSLLVSRSGDEEHYELTALALADLQEIFGRYREFIEQDGRHEVTIRAIGFEVVYDQHNILTITGGPNPEALFQDAGLHEGPVCPPSPHSHHYHDEMDPTLEELLESYEWARR